MENYKVKVSSEAEIKEAQELFFELGALLGNGDKHAVLVPNTVGLAVIDDLINFVFNDVVFADIKQCKELTIPQLKDIVVLKRNSIKDATHACETIHKRKGYLSTDGTEYLWDYVYSFWCVANNESNFNTGKLKPILKPMKEYLVKENGGYVLHQGGVMLNGAVEVPEGMNFAYDSGSTGFFFTTESRLNYKSFLIWQRFTQPEELPFIDDEPKPSVNDQYAEIEQVRQDSVNNPSHYASGDIECIDAIESSMTPEAFRGYCKGNVQKYIWRYEQKGGKESLEKAQRYLNRLLGTF